ncbi:NfeD family protein [uncultured Brachyspira sp.]|uniref:NfeD family protein n=1 Tax=uncultured Brachyspira sp. TaxID=221953 RepID=UPI00260B46D9|nr:NfeD family protein [uncultured Brachyspira sp.]
MKNILKIFVITIFVLSNIVYAADNKIYVIRKQEFQEVNRWYAGYIKKAIDKAYEDKADLIILELDTPGGLLSSALSIKNYIIESDVPVVVYINKNALSAGALISLSAKEIYMSDGSVIGAATPIYVNGNEPKKASEKEVSAMRAAMRASAEANNKNVRAAEAMVDETIVLNRKSDGIDLDDKTLLTLSADEAVKINIADKKANSIEEIIKLKGLDKNYTIVDIEEEQYDSVLKFLLNPFILSLLISIGIAGIYLEIKTPGFGVGGVTAIVAFSVFFFAQFLSGDSNLLAPAIFVLGIILLGVEIFLIPGFGVTGILGIIGIVSSIFMSFGINNIAAATLVVFISLIVDIILIILIARFFVKSKDLKRNVILDSDTSGYNSSVSYNELLNKEGIADTFFRPSGYIIIDNKKYDAISEGEFIDKGSKLKVVLVEGNKIVVKKII